MPEEKLQTLSLQVINGSELESGRAARCLFTQQGNVGHGPECHWSVQDRQQSIPAQAFTVILHDGTFCLRPQTAQLWLNQAKVTATSDLIQLRQGDEIHLSDTLEEVASLSARFGIVVTFGKPDKDHYLNLVLQIARQEGLQAEQETLLQEAEAFALRSGGRSPRVARQYVEYKIAMCGGLSCAK